jgi:hypothetical protein
MALCVSNYAQGQLHLNNALTEYVLDRKPVVRNEALEFYPELLVVCNEISG